MKKGGSSALAAMIKQKSVTLYGSDTGADNSSASSAVYLSTPINSPHSDQDVSNKVEVVNQSATTLPSKPVTTTSASISSVVNVPNSKLQELNQSPSISANISSTSPSKPFIAAKSSVLTDIKNSQPVKYTPTVVKMAFESTPKCTVCGKSVYKMEEVIAVGRIWHSACFTCGGNNSNQLGCKRVLTRHGYVDHENDPFCNTCHSKLFKPKGYGHGNSLELDYGPGMTKSTISNPTTAEIAVNNGKTIIAPSRPSVFQKQASESTIPVQKAATATTTIATGGAPKCTICMKSVYKAEEVIAVGHVWHKACFTCGARSDDGCKRVLNITNYLDHDNCPYCNTCYSKLFKPKGYGHGSSLELDYGPSSNSTSNSVGAITTVQDVDTVVQVVSNLNINTTTTISNTNSNSSSSKSKVVGINNVFPQPNPVAPIPTSCPSLEIGKTSSTRGIY